MSKEIEEDIELILQFNKYNDNGELNPKYVAWCANTSDTKYDWNWLMEIIERIENMKDEDHCYMYCVDMGRDFCVITYNDFKRISITAASVPGNKLMSAFKAIVQFIKWHNENSKRNNH